MFYCSEVGCYLLEHLEDDRHILVKRLFQL